MEPVQRLRIGQATAEDRIDGEARRWPVTEFYIDGRPLSDWLGIGRDLLYFGTDLDPDQPQPLRERGLALFLGRSEPSNQFGSGRLVLYRCHCGCDYCGVISCRLETDGDHMLWQDVTREDDDGPAAGHNAADSSAPELTPVARFVFDRAQYEQELERHFAR